MSALGSSVINKSTKKFAPKAPVRRAAAGHSDQPAANTSNDRRTQSQTPQPQAAQNVTRPSPAPTDPTAPGASDPRDHASVVVAVRPPSNVTPTRTTVGGVRNDRSPSVSSLVPQKRPIPAANSHEDGPSLRLEAQKATTSTLNKSQSTNITAKPTPSERSFREPNASSETVTTSLVGEPNAKRQKRAEQPSNIAQNTRTATNDADLTLERPNQTSVTAESNEDPTVAIASPEQPGERSDTRARTPQRSSTRPDVSETSTAHEKPRRGRKKKVTAGEVNNVEHEIPPASAVKPKRQYRKRRARQTIEDAAEEIVQEAVEGSSRQPKRKARKRKRSPTPENAENIQIAPSEVKMAELCSDTRTGRISAREQELRELDRAAFVKKKQHELKEVMEDAGTAPSADPGTGGGENEEARRDAREEVALNVPNTIIVDGQIQIDESSLGIDRHAAAAVERDAEQLEGIEENDYTRKVNSATWMKRDKSGGWNNGLLDRFYDGLRMFGTDFGMISKLFPGKSRHAIKLKFGREERDNAEKIKEILSGAQLPVDLDEFQKLTGVEYEDPAILEREMEEDRKALEEEQAAEVAAIEKARKERAEQVAAEKETTTGDESPAKENRGKGKRKKKKGTRAGSKTGAARTKARKQPSFS